MFVDRCNDIIVEVLSIKLNSANKLLYIKIVKN